MKLFYFSFPGSAQLILNKTKPVEYTICNKTVLIPCFVSNVEAVTLEDFYLKWKFGNENVFTFVGYPPTSTPGKNFPSATIVPEALLNGTASLKMDRDDAVPGNYTCEVTELSREGETIVELKHRVGKTTVKASFYFFCSKLILLEMGQNGARNSIESKSRLNNKC